MAQKPYIIWSLGPKALKYESLGKNSAASEAPAPEKPEKNELSGEADVDLIGLLHG